jgi:hypothetical protein
MSVNTGRLNDANLPQDASGIEFAIVNLKRGALSAYIFHVSINALHNVIYQAYVHKVPCTQQWVPWNVWHGSII